MKKLMRYGLLLLLSIPLLCACGDEEGEAAEPVKATMTMFRISEITGISYPHDPFEVHATGNAMHLHWFGVGECAGYEIMYAQKEKVSDDVAAWQHPENIEGRFVVSAQRCDTTLQDLKYATTYSFAIRVLSADGEAYHSDWFGIGTDRQWGSLCQRQTEEPDTLDNEEALSYNTTRAEHFSTDSTTTTLPESESYSH